jgi:hypothetical protein
LITRTISGRIFVPMLYVLRGSNSELVSPWQKLQRRSGILHNIPTRPEVVEKYRMHLFLAGVEINGIPTLLWSQYRTIHQRISVYASNP